jgi:ubiquinone/menaquinone biosynthesis C-methylase UbiE
MSAAETKISPPEALLNVLVGFWTGRAIYVAAKLGIADLVKQGPMSIEELASMTGTHARSLYRLMRGLASVGWFEEDAEGRFGATAFTAAIETDSAFSLRYLAMTELGEEHYPAWENLLYSVRTGEIAFNDRFGMSNWEFWNKNPEHAEIFNKGMSNMTALIEPALIAAYDFSPLKKIIDIGGGRGTLLTSILRQNETATGVVFDLPHVIDLAKQDAATAAVGDRCQLVQGDFFKSVTAGGDAYILKWILHDWNDEQCIAILSNCRKAISPNGKLLVIEAVLPGRNEPSLNKFMDLNMLVMTGGCERTEAEYHALFESAGFRLTRAIPTPSGFSWLEGVAAD